jgi:hypothetical protein
MADSVNDLRASAAARSRLVEVAAR